MKSLICFFKGHNWNIRSSWLFPGEQRWMVVSRCVRCKKRVTSTGAVPASEGN